eukprot:SAG31_NODE_1993_length_6709_cov_5.744024_4_plen_95_part_00
MARFLTTSANGHSAEIDRELKPSKEERAHLADILRRPPTVPINPDDQFMVWRFRYYLAKENASALPKFCKVVDWCGLHFPILFAACRLASSRLC